MPLKIFLSSTLRKYIPDYDAAKGMSLVADRKMTVLELCERIKIPADKIKIIMVDGKNKYPDYILKGDERVALFPPVGGG